MKKVGFIGWRGLVGSVLIRRMQEEHDFDNISVTFFSTSNVGMLVPIELNSNYNNILQDAYDLSILIKLDIIITCQGSNYTKNIYYTLRILGWKGYWLDSASLLRTYKNAVIVLDPINNTIIENSLNHGIKTFIGGNCTVSLMLMSLGGLFFYDLIDWIVFSTYQAASGAGAFCIIELLKQMGKIYFEVSDFLKDKFLNILDIDKRINKFMKSNYFPIKNFSVPLAGNLIPWIDKQLSNGQSKEEWKSKYETNKILNKKNISIDGICVRVGSLRCHSQFFTIKLKKNISVKEIENIIYEHNNWVNLIPNNSDISIKNLTPVSVSGTLNINVGRLRKLNIKNDKYVSAFTVGDQLLWGAAEPIRRMMNKLIT